MSNISRSEYQRVCEENKKLKQDIKLLVSETYFGEKGAKKILLVQEWRNKFKEDNFVSDILKEYSQRK